MNNIARWFWFRIISSLVLSPILAVCLFLRVEFLTLFGDFV